MYSYPSFGRFYPNMYRPYPHINTVASTTSKSNMSMQNHSQTNNNQFSKKSDDEVKNEDNRSNSKGNVAFFPAQSKKQNPSQDSDVFDIFGLSLHFDDILIVGLLIFLYMQEVDDPYLFMCLIFLLLS